MDQAVRQKAKSHPKWKVLLLAGDLVRSSSRECTGPLLFVIFINDMDDTVEHLTSILQKFANDTKLGKKVRMD